MASCRNNNKNGRSSSPLQSDIACERPLVPQFSSWNFIWTFFLYSPEVRSFLFQNKRPTASELFQSFQNAPSLNGFDFSVPKLQHFVSHPDIGDLKTVLTTVNETILGFNFGYKGIYPVIPNIYEGTNDPHLKNPKVIIRRTASKFISICNVECFLSIEFSWMQSGVLAVTTFYCAIRNVSEEFKTSNHGPVIDHGEIRLFLPDEVKPLLKSVSTLDGNSLSPDKPIPHNILKPRQHYVYRIYEADNYVVPKFLPICFQNRDSNTIIKSSLEFRSVNELTFEQRLGMTLFSQNFNQLQAENESFTNTTLNTWERMSSMVEGSRRNGTLYSNIQFKDTKISLEENLENPPVRYNYLFSRHQVSLRERIQKLLGCLDLNYSKPDIDKILINFQIEQPEHQKVLHVEVSAETSSYYGENVSTSRKDIEEHRDLIDKKDRAIDTKIKNRSSHTTNSMKRKPNYFSDISHEHNTSLKRKKVSNTKDYLNEKISTNATNADATGVNIEDRKKPENETREFWQCETCGAVIKGKRGNLKRHIMAKHYNVRQFQCSYSDCGSKFQNRVNLVRHEAAVHDGRPFHCPKCPRKFKHREEADSHLRNAHDRPGNKHSCDICGSYFDVKGTLNRHRRTVHQ